MTFFILTLFKAGYKLRTSTLYHLLVGKRTSSVLLHGFFHENLPYLGALPNLKEEVFRKELQRLIEKQLILVNYGFGELTVEGQRVLGKESYPFYGLNNLRYGRMRENMWHMILFSVQVISHLSFNEKNYLPIENRPYYLQQIKKWLAHSKVDVIVKFKQELELIFQKLPVNEADFLANQFSGVEFQGKTAYQLLPEKWLEEPWSSLYQQNAIDLFLAQVMQDNSGEIFRLLSNLDQQNLNQSMLITKQFFLAGKSIDEILKLRHLKQGTVNDHFIEWALIDENFPFKSFELINFNELDKNQIVNARFQEYDSSYLTFRLSQIYRMREK